MKKRRAPKRADADVWAAFQVWADGAGIGEASPDWRPWWECWSAGYHYGYMQYGLNA